METIRTSSLQNSIQLPVDKNIGIATDRGGEMSVEGLIQGIVLVFSNVQHSRAEVLGALRCFGTK
jgi:hypothetical protein